MKFDELIKSLTPERYETLKRAVELGKWPDSRTLGKEERETSLQIIIAYDLIHKPENERVGFIPTSECDDAHEMDAEFPVIKNLIVKN